LIIVAFIMGIAILAPAAEWAGLRRGDERWAAFSRQLGSTIVRLFAFGATWAVFAVVFIFALFPRLWGELTSIFFWPLIVIAGGIWFVMSVSAYLYYETWDRLKDHRGLHILIGVVFATSAFIFITLIVELTSYQLTPVPPTSLAAAAFNPSWLTEVIHRHIGNVSYAGLLLAGMAGGMIVFLNKNREYYDWVGHVALSVGLILTFLQPFAGWFYANQIRLASPDAYFRMMIGSNSFLFLTQTLLFNLTLLLASLYLAMTVTRGDASRLTVVWMRRFTIVILLLTVLGFVPQQWPLGAMRPWKYISIGGTWVLAAASLILYLKTSHTFVFGRISKGSQAVLVAVGVIIVALIINMGVIRESARGSYLIYGQPGSGQGQQFLP